MIETEPHPVHETPRTGQAFRRARVRRRAAIVALQMAAIVFSILLALMLDEWRQNAQQRATTEAVLETVRTEASANRASLERALAHHQDMLRQFRDGGIEIARVPLSVVPADTADGDGLAAFLASQIWEEQGARMTGAEARRLEDGRWSLMYDQGRFIVGFAGDTLVLRGSGNISLAPPFLTNASWETAQITQVAVLLPPDLIALLTRIEQLHRRVDGTTGRLVDMIYGAHGVHSAWHMHFQSALTDLHQFEREMVEAYDELLAYLDSR